MALLLDGRRLGIALDHNQAPQHGPVFAGHILPRRFTEMLSERNRPIVLTRREQNSPAVFGHLHVVEFRPALRVYRYGRAQIDQRFLETFWSHVMPPVEIAGVPAFKRPQDAAIFGEPDI